MGPELLWRRGRDSNPRYSFGPYTGLANQRLEPLGHLSSTVVPASAGGGLLDRAPGAVKEMSDPCARTIARRGHGRNEVEGGGDGRGDGLPGGRPHRGADAADPGG